MLFDTIGWAPGRASGQLKLSDEVLVWLFVCSKVQTVCTWYSWHHCHPKTRSFLASFKSRLVLPFSLPRLSWKRRRWTGVAVNNIWFVCLSTIQWWINNDQVPVVICLQCFDAVGWAAGRASGLQKTEWWGTGVVILSGARCRLAYGPADATATHCLLLQ